MLVTDDAGAGTALVKAMLVEQTRLLYAGLPTAIIGNSVLVLILVSVQRAVIPQPHLLSWIAMIGTILLARAVLLLAWHRGSHDVTNASRWRRYFRIGAIATGSAWGAAVILVFPPGDVPHQVFIAFVLAGVCAGAITSLAVDRVSTLGFLLAALLPLIARFAMQDDAISLAMSAMVLVFLGVIVMSAMRAGRSLRENFLLRLNAEEQQQVLRQSEMRLHQAQRSAHIGNWELDLISNKLHWSDEIYRIFEIDPDTFGACYEAFLDAIHPDDREQVNQVFTDSLTKREPYDIVHRMCFADGRVKYVHERCETDFDPRGMAIRSLGTVQDITQLKLVEAQLYESEKNYRMLFENSRDALMTMDPSVFRFTSANRATLQMFKAVSEAEFTKRGLWDVSPETQPDGRSSSEKAMQMIEIALRDGTNYFEWTHKRLDNITFETEVLLSRMEQNGQIYLQGTVRDITERKRLEREIMQQRHDMEKLQKIQVAAQTAAAIAHELNQPLLAIASYSEAALILLNAASPNLDKIRETIEGSERQALRAGQSIRDLLDYLSMKEFPREVFDLNQEIVNMIDAVKSEREIPFHCVLLLEEQLPWIWANRTHVRKVLSNLLYNGIEAMHGAKLPLSDMTLSVRTLKDEKLIKLTIQDNGPGLNHAGIQRLFEPFFTTKSSGIGMGLAISRALIEMNGGRLWVDPQAVPGATFHLTLPIAI